MQICERELALSYKPQTQLEAMKVLVVDDDACFRRLISAAADPAKMQVEGYESLADMGSFSCINNYHVAIIDYYLPIMNGIEIAEYIDAFFDHIPVVLVSAATPVDLSSRTLPECVQRFVCKSQGVKAIVAAALELANSSPPRMASGYSS